ncbi:RdgB/HAM1 family non-canonical purine NTP pyrophosphatase [Arthrobacter sp. UM1]|uniref:RdgB/HAM1 family non-canonical purine NTP pyrophosphatase n=1 Tax=Arthrobacter sp. UM1 TaxID=2766776 RepID=UPI001CF68E8E|nr:RdgB/HAM1 family non-canonical purine NTP pyrophosphatase [Arthrobacter sp. UM1]MCB4207258.1 RdgB/HAM1 family non-canonical purine NTP pyrophosphatase [Arthrobacter sp. UM1]
MSGARLVLASHNKGKLRELRAMIAEQAPELDVDSLVVDAAAAGAPDVAETGVTFEENARLKAEAIAQETGLAALADDSGLCVDVLGGAPGFLSARWSGRHGDDEANLRLLLAQLADVPDGHRAGGFECRAALAVPGAETAVTQGSFRGVILREPRGEGGFGYDPILQPDGREESAAELDPAEKNRLSHRGAAMRAMMPRILEVLKA